jgi:hypothetical protein
MKQEGVKRVRGGQLSASYKTKAQHLAEYKSKLKELEAQLEVIKTQPPSPYVSVESMEIRIRNIKQYIKAKSRR